MPYKLTNIVTARQLLKLLAAGENNLL
jgi:hypothetical protein